MFVRLLYLQLVNKDGVTVTRNNKHVHIKYCQNSIEVCIDSVQTILRAESSSNINCPEKWLNQRKELQIPKVRLRRKSRSLKRNRHLKRVQTIKKATKNRIRFKDQVHSACVRVSFLFVRTSFLQYTLFLRR